MKFSCSALFFILNVQGSLKKSYYVQALIYSTAKGPRVRHIISTRRRASEDVKKLQNTEETILDGDRLRDSVNVLVKAGVVGATTGACVGALKQSISGTESFAYNELLLALFSGLGDASNTGIGSTLVYASIPAIGGLVVGFLGILPDGKYSPFVRATQAVATLGTGNSLGPEGPCVELGVSVAQTFQEKKNEEKILVAAGSAAAVAAGFAAPVAGIFFALEATLRDEKQEQQLALLPRTALAGAALAAAISAVVARDIMQCRLEIENSVPSSGPAGLAELPLYLGLGALAGFEAIALARATNFFEKQWAKSLVPIAFRPAIAGAVCGIVGVACPQVLFNGYATLNTILADNQPPATLTLLLYAAVKIATTASSRSSGLVGGLFAPSLFLGGCGGCAYGQFVAWLFGNDALNLLHVAQPPAYASVGAASVLAAVVKAPLTASMLLFELTRDYDVILPLVASTGVATIVLELFQDPILPRSRALSNDVLPIDSLDDTFVADFVPTPPHNDHVSGADGSVDDDFD
uniref:Chloride channel protein n=1 Tax=Aureoumbra lagunensis TaxID=44058 RepID=A0A7S3JSI1_9STRA|mmetsp:Transcript_9042/g.13917  ORF Transcript_9042/g.13917 Transcript_9042/m.13917 type:complete len:523 (+) Transcript_9042:47-1615(+)